MHMPPAAALSETEKLARLRLIRTENIGPVTFFRLLERFGTAAQALEHVPELAARGGRRAALKVCTVAAAEAELAKLRDAGGTALYWGDAGYPPLLAHIDGAPPVLFVRGHAHLLSKKAIAIVGSRNASVNGQRFAGDMARALGEAGFLIVSGMARGIDTAAHAGALASGTVAVLGGGVDVIYPRENAKLYEALLETGAICSEMSIGTVPQARHFPPRNRIISGIARAIVVLEAGAKSGSLITARMALEQGREVFAVPGAPQDPRVKGANWLLREGAYLTESAADVLTVLAQADPAALQDRRRPVLGGVAAPVDPASVERARADVLNALSYSPTHIDAIVRITGHGAAAVAAVLLELEVAGRLERHPGHKASLLEE